MISTFAAVFESMEPRVLLSASDLVATWNEGSFYSTLVPGDKVTMPLTLTNNGASTEKATLGVSMYFSKDQTLSGEDRLLGSMTKAVNLVSGAAADFKVAGTIPVGMSPDAYYLIFVVGGVATAGYIPHTVAWKFGSFAGRTKVTLSLSGPVADSGGAVTTFSMTGIGYGQVAPHTDPVAPGEKVGYDFTVYGAGTSSAVAVSAAANAGVLLHNVTVAATSLKSLAAPNLGLIGSIAVAGGLGTLTLGDVGATLSDDVSITVGAAASLPLAATFGRVNNLQLSTLTAIKSLTLVEWQDSYDAVGTAAGDHKDTLTAPSIAKLTVTGRKAGSIAGDFNTDLAITGATKSSNLPNATIPGDVTGRTWRVSGNIGKLTVGGTVGHCTIRSTGNMDNITLGASDTSDFLAGILDDGSVTRHAALAGDFANTSARVNKFTVAGWKIASGAPIPRFFIDSNISAAKVGNVSLANIKLSNSSTPFGLFVKNVTGLGEVGSVKSQDTESGWDWSWKPKNPNGFVLDDFIVQVI
jgi:hypothetical protein